MRVTAHRLFDANGHFVFALAEMEMPGMSGIEDLSHFRQHDDKIFRAICAGAAGYLLQSSGTEAIAGAAAGVC